MPVISPLDSFHLVSSPPQSKLCLSVWHVVIVPFPYQIISLFFFFFPVEDAAAVWTHIILALIAAHVALKTPRNPSADYTASIMAEKCC